MRHEYKHRISYADYLVITSRLKHIASRDANVGETGRYMVHSLYFDNLSDKALREKLDGVDKREKFRIRYYNQDTSYIRLEKKSKIHGLCDKQSAPLTREQVEQIVNGQTEFLKEAPQELLRELYLKMKNQLLRPKTIVDYEREPYVYAPGNVRITFDSHIKTGLFHRHLFEEQLVTVPTEPQTMIMEVKYDAFLPEIIQQAVRVPNRQASAFSKYAMCRIYG